MADWIALSDRDEPMPRQVLERGLLVVEYKLPILEPAILLQFQSMPAEARQFTVLFDPEKGLSVLNRQGAVLRRHRLPGPLTQRQGTGRLSFRFDAGRQSWQIEHRVLGEADEAAQRASGAQVSALDLADFQVICLDGPGGQRHPSVLWFGVTQQDEPDQAGWLGLNTPVETRRGPVRAGLLRPGDLIATLEDGFVPLLKARRQRFPGRGSFSPVVLRSPYFSASTDLLMAADQLVMISGASVEYLFGEDEVLVPAGALADGCVALRDGRRALCDAVTLDLGAPVTLIADGCCLISAHARGAELPRRVLRDFETLPLQSLLGRVSLRHVA